MLANTPVPLTTNEHDYAGELARRMARPQRHRLLHGYPMSSGMTPIHGPVAEILNELELDSSEKLAVGIIPHPYCNPRVQGCG